MGMTTAPGGRWGRFYENGVVVAQDGKEARRCYETGEKLGSVKCKMRLARCKLLGIGGRRAKKAGLDLCRQALELAKESSEKEDYGYEAEMNLLRRTIAEKRIIKDEKMGRFGAMS